MGKIIYLNLKNAVKEIPHLLLEDLNYPNLVDGIVKNKSETLKRLVQKEYEFVMQIRPETEERRRFLKAVQDSFMSYISPDSSIDEPYYYILAFYLEEDLGIIGMDTEGKLTLSITEDSTNMRASLILLNHFYATMKDRDDKYVLETILKALLMDD